MFTRTVVGLSALVLGLILALSAGFPVTVAAQGASANKQFALREAMRKLWEDHVTWTRLYIVSAVADIPDKETTGQRLLQNQADIGNAVASFYGKPAGDKLTALLRTHILTAVDLIAAAKQGDTAKVKDASARWYANADDIAAFLSGANPKNWPLVEMRSMMRAHLDHTLAEAVARVKGDWAADVVAYDRVHQQILEMADMLSTGMIRQFPQKFR